MRMFTKLAVAATLLVGGTFGASAQYYSMINQATNMVQNAFLGGMRYRGMVDVSYVQGVGNRRADFLEFSTTQGLKYADWFYMGIGMGVDVMFAHANNGFNYNDVTRTACTIPLFTDFRFLIGNESQPSFYIDIKAGCSFLINDRNVQIGDGYMGRSEYFYLKPGIGCRIPVATNSKCAFNLAVVYNLLTSNYWYSSYDTNITLSAFGVSIGYEW